MAQIREVRLVDDLDGSQAVETLEFSLAGRNYEIDLSEDNAKKLRDALAPFVNAARRVTARRRPGSSAGASGSRTSVADREQNQAIREWARKRGMKVSDRGRIPVEVLEAYNRRDES